jgi:hypothetical protein
MPFRLITIKIKVVLEADPDVAAEQARLGWAGGGDACSTRGNEQHQL